MRKYLPVSILALGAVALLLAGCTDGAKKKRHLAAAAKYFAAGDYEKAEIEYKNVLQLESLQPDAVSQLGIIYFDQGRVTSVYPLLKKAEELQPNNLAVRAKLGVFYLIAGKPDEAKNEALYVLQRNPKHPDAPLLLASAMTSAKDGEQSRQYLAGLPTANTAPVKAALGFLDMRDGRFLSAARTLDEAIKLDPKFTEAHAARAALHLGRNEKAEGEAEMKLAAETARPRSPRRLEYAQFKLQGDVATGRRLMEEITKQTPDYLPAHFALAKLALGEGRLDDAQAEVEKALARDRVHPEGILLSAQINSAKGKPEKAIEELERAKAVYPRMPELHYQLGSIQASRSNVERAIDSLQQAIALKPDHTEAILLLTSLQIRKGESKSAATLLKNMLARQSGNLRGWLLLADAYRAESNYPEAIAVYEHLDRIAPGNPQPSYMRGLVYLQTRKPAEARRAFTESLKRTPGFSPALEQLVGLDVAEKKYDDAQSRVEARIAEQPKDAYNQILLARVLAARKEEKKAEEALLKAITLQPDLSTPYLLLANLYLATNRQESALKNLEEAIVRNSKDIQPLMTAAAIYDARKNHVKAREYYEKIIAVNPRFAPALNNLAYLYSTKFNEVNKAFDLAQKARALRPQDPQIADTLGWVLFQRKQYSWAATLIQESAEKNVSDGEVQYHLGMAYYMAGNEDAARAALQRALDTKKEFTGREEAQQKLTLLNTDVATLTAAQRAELLKTIGSSKEDPIALARAANIKEADGDLRGAAESYQASLELSPDNVKAMLRLAEIHRGAKELPRALEVLKKARKVAPDNVAVTHALGRAAFESADYEWSNSLLQEATRQSPDSPAILADYARAAFAVGRIADAEAAWSKVVEAEPASPRAEEARTSLALSAGARNASDAPDSDAKISAALKANPNNAVALMASAARSEAKGDTTAAQATYEKILESYPTLTSARKQLAVLYSNQPSATNKAYDNAMKVFETAPDDVELRRLIGILLYRKGEFARAVTMLGEVGSKRAKDGEVFYYLGLAYKQLGNKAASAKALKQALELDLKPELAAEARRILSASTN